MKPLILLFRNNVTRNFIKRECSTLLLVGAECGEIGLTRHGLPTKAAFTPNVLRQPYGKPCVRKIPIHRHRTCSKNKVFATWRIKGPDLCVERPRGWRWWDSEKSRKWRYCT